MALRKRVHVASSATVYQDIILILKIVNDVMTLELVSELRFRTVKELPWK